MRKQRNLLKPIFNIRDRRAIHDGTFIFIVETILGLNCCIKIVIFCILCIFLHFLTAIWRPKRVSTTAILLSQLEIYNRILTKKEAIKKSFNSLRNCIAKYWQCDSRDVHPMHIRMQKLMQNASIDVILMSFCI